MKNIIYIMIILISCNIQNLNCQKIPVYICNGQSNARAEWAYAVGAEIKKIEPDAIILWIWHPGDSIIKWWDGTPQSNLIEDCHFFQNELNSIDYDIKGFFWFQGEADRYPDKFPYYAYRFINMINYIKYELNDSEFDIMISYVYSTLPDHNMTYIRLIQKNIVKNYYHYFGFDSMGYPRDDGLHLTLPGRVLFGKNQTIYYLNNR